MIDFDSMICTPKTKTTTTPEDRNSKGSFYTLGHVRKLLWLAVLVLSIPAISQAGPRSDQGARPEVGAHADEATAERQPSQGRVGPNLRDMDDPIRSGALEIVSASHLSPRLEPTRGSRSDSRNPETGRSDQRSRDNEGAGNEEDHTFGRDFDDGTNVAIDLEVLTIEDAFVQFSMQPRRMFVEDRERTTSGIDYQWTEFRGTSLKFIESQCRKHNYRITEFDFVGAWPTWPQYPGGYWNVICVQNKGELYRKSWEIFEGTEYELFLHNAKKQHTVVEVEVREHSDLYKNQVRYAALTVAKGAGIGEHPSTMPALMVTMDHLDQLFAKGYRPIEIDRLEHRYPGSEWDHFDGISLERFNAVLIKNEGANYRNWWWAISSEGADLAGLESELGARIVDYETLKPIECDNRWGDCTQEAAAHSILGHAGKLAILYALQPGETVGPYADGDMKDLRPIDRETLLVVVPESYMVFGQTWEAHYYTQGLLLMAEMH